MPPRVAAEIGSERPDLLFVGVDGCGELEFAHRLTIARADRESHG
jgi:hypothetical protein